MGRRVVDEVVHGGLRVDHVGHGGEALLVPHGGDYADARHARHLNPPRYFSQKFSTVKVLNFIRSSVCPAPDHLKQRYHLSDLSFLPFQSLQILEVLV